MSINSHSHLLGLKMDSKDLIRLSKGSSKVLERGGIIGTSTIEPLPRQPCKRKDKEEYLGVGKVGS